MYGKNNNSDVDVYRVLSPTGRNLFRIAPSGQERSPYEVKTPPKEYKPPPQVPDDVFIIDAKLWKAMNLERDFPKMVVQRRPPPAPESVPVQIESEPSVPTEYEDIDIPVVTPIASMPEFFQSDSIEGGFFETRVERPAEEEAGIDPAMMVSRFNPHRPIFEFNKDRPARKYIVKLGLPPSAARPTKQRSDHRRRR